MLEWLTLLKSPFETGGNPISNRTTRYCLESDRIRSVEPPAIGVRKGFQGPWLLPLGSIEVLEADIRSDNA